MQGSCMAGLSYLSHPVIRLGRTYDSENAHRYWGAQEPTTYRNTLLNKDQA